MTTPTLALRQGVTAQAVVNMTTGRNATLRAIFIFFTIEFLTSQTFELPPPKVGY
jgi:hypothetical protein